MKNKLSVVLVFDDGYLDIYRYAYPILKDRGMVGTFAIITSRVGSTFPDYANGNTIWRELELADWNQIHEMHDDGWDIASHTRTHWGFAKAGGRFTTIDEIAPEIQGSKADIEEHGIQCTTFISAYTGYTNILFNIELLEHLVEENYTYSRSARSDKIYVPPRYIILNKNVKHHLSSTFISENQSLNDIELILQQIKVTDSATIFTFHNVSPNIKGAEHQDITPEKFNDVVNLIDRCGISTITLPQYFEIKKPISLIGTLQSTLINAALFMTTAYISRALIRKIKAKYYS